MNFFDYNLQKKSYDGVNIKVKISSQKNFPILGF